MTQHTPILIVGAGPTGLVLACELARFGIPFRIIDKKSSQTKATNATWVLPRTLEIFDLMGIVERFLKAGNPCKAINFYIQGKHSAALTMDQVDSLYQFILMLPQRETEEILVKYLQELNRSVEHNTELLNIKHNEKIVTADIKTADQQTITLTCDWLVACDGANSTVRTLCHASFPGEDLKEQFMVADAVIRSFMTENEVHAFFDKGTIFVASPLGGNKYRVMANLHVGAPRQSFYAKELIELIQERGYGNYYVEDIDWISPFWVHGKTTSGLRYGPIFLVGDAAHIHSPVGGQGMNMGIQDAANLAWKLALVYKNNGRPELLDSYQEERLPIIKNRVEEIENYTKKSYEDSFLKELKKFTKMISTENNTLIKEVDNTLSQVHLSYAKSPIIHYSNMSKHNVPKPGERAPDVVIDQNKRLYDFLREPLHHILLFTKNNESDYKKATSLQTALEKKFPNLVSLHVISRSLLPDHLHVIQDTLGQVAKTYGIMSAETVFVIRPDNFICYYAELLDADHILSFLSTYLINITT